MVRDASLRDAPHHEAGRGSPRDAHPCRQFLSRAADGIPDRARAGREDHGEADEVAGGGDGSTYWINGS